MKKIILGYENFSAEFEADENGVYISGGHFGDIEIKKAPLFRSRIKKAGEKSDKSVIIDSASSFSDIVLEKTESCVHIELSNPEGFDGITYITDAYLRESCIEFELSVVNNSSIFSVMDTTYPAPAMCMTEYDVFDPTACGRVIKNAGEKNHSYTLPYPGKTSMQYFAFYTKESGIYFGIHDTAASHKEIEISCTENLATIDVHSFGKGGNTAGNSHTLPGKMVWQLFHGDWYDATMIYSQFVNSEAPWTAKHDKTGRTDTHQKFKDAVVWVMDYIPNSAEQGDNKPMTLSAESDIYAKDYWITAPIQLRKELGVPLCYHVYNWQEIPFNINYPHFMPARKEFLDGLKKLQENNIYVMPYINALSWEMYDGEDGYEVNFENTGKHGAVILEDGDYRTIMYPQTKKSGKKSHLVTMCGTDKKWQQMMVDLTRELETTGVDGIYFDQIAATGYHTCYNEEHDHLPGDPAAVTAGYKEIMEKINNGKPDEMYYFTENTSENYVNSFDGLLSWIWLVNGDVPAFPAIYSGQVQVVGRMTSGEKKEDYNYFKYFMAKTLLYGQQLGWCKADIVYNKKALGYFKKLVDVRYKYRKIFNAGRLMRPPVVTTTAETLVTTNYSMYKQKDVYMEQALAGAWSSYDGNEKLIILINNSENNAQVTMKFNYVDYGIKREALPDIFSTDDTFAYFDEEMRPNEIKIWNISD